GAIWTMSFSKDGKFLATGGQDTVVRVWAVISSDEEREYFLGRNGKKNAFDDVSGTKLGAPVFREKPLYEYTGHTADLLDLSWSKNNFLLSSSMDKTVRLWHITRKECLCCFQHTDFVTSIAFHPKDDRFFLSGSLDCKLRLWNISEKRVAHWHELTDSQLITSVGFTLDGKFSVVGTLKGLCLFYETDGLRYHTQIHVKSSHGRNSQGKKITGIEPFPGTPAGQEKLLISSNDSRIRLYNMRDKSLECKYKGMENTCGQISATFSDDGRYIITGSEDRHVYIFNADQASINSSHHGSSSSAHPAVVTTAIFAPTRTKQLIAHGGDPIYSNTINHDTSIPSDKFTYPDGNIIVSADNTGRIKIFRQDCAYYHSHDNDSSSILSTRKSHSTFTMDTCDSTKGNINLSEFDGIVLGVFKDGTLCQTVSGSNQLPEDFLQIIKQKLEYSGCSKGRLGECKVLHGIDKFDAGAGDNLRKKIAIVGLGKKRYFNTCVNDQELAEVLEIARNAAAIGVRSLREKNAKNILVDVMTNEHGAAEGAVLGLYYYDTLKSAKNQKSPVKITPLGSKSTSTSTSYSSSLTTSFLPSSSSITTATTVGAAKDLTWETGIIYAEAQNFTRTLMETPANYMTPTKFTEHVKSKLTGLPNVEVIIRNKDWVEGKKMGSFLSVSRGSDEPLKFLEIHYKGGKEGDKPLAFVGKGITFDSGGISLKQPLAMLDMKADMGGGAAVVASVYGIAKLGLPINLVATVPLCENMPSGHATKPGDVVIAMNGKSIEVINTDAEGRLILADALYYTSSTFLPHTLIDMATLTGAMCIALDEAYSGVFTNSNEVWELLSNAGKTTNDRFWRMPLDDQYKKKLVKSSVADLINSAGKPGGSCIAASFLKEFVYGLCEDLNKTCEGRDGEVEDDEGEMGGVRIKDASELNCIKYAHIDIAGVMFTTTDHAYNVEGMTESQTSINPSITTAPVTTPRSPRIEIEFCIQCRWTLRAGWMAQELFITFGNALGEVALIPGMSAVFKVTIDGEIIWDRKKEGRFPELKELKQLIRNKIAPDMKLGHSDAKKEEDNNNQNATNASDATATTITSDKKTDKECKDYKKY
ncbi:3523_t:CDS:10, partial [Entrophospora sp. SA101]